TLAVSAIWVIIRWFLGPYSAFPIVSHPALMWEFMSATAAGIFFSLLYKLYLRHKKHFKKSD
ncbi:MAG: hypothetical protein SVV03_03325, partial [Candidatus Nanohaloarchaea archaeon]|nr:hypothetical protein [Candidatus Nanohaloarchaea archaeon]